MLPGLTLLIGGAASGKSRMAETLAERHGKTKVYLATAQVFDDEMAEKVERHKNRRSSGWITVETPMNAADELRGAAADVVLLDCATLWLTNQMLAETPRLAEAQAELLDGLRACPAPVLVVSNEVGDGIVPENALARAFREAQGALNIALAAEADLVIRMTAGLPLVLKGQMP